MQCPYCGAQNDALARFCHACGGRLTDGAAPRGGPVPPFEGAPYPPSDPPRESVVPLVLGIVGLVFAILLPAIAYICAGFGLYFANRELNTGRTARTHYRTLNVTALCIAAVNSLLGALMYM